MKKSHIKWSARLCALSLVVACSAISAFGAQTQPPRQAFLTRPDIHGDQVVFTAEGDLWLADVNTGDARRITSDPGVESWARFSPDGTQIAFTANYDGGSDVYVIPTAGGIPKRLTFDSGRAQVLGWTPDGKSVLFRTNSKLYASEVEQSATYQLFTVPVSGGAPTLLPVPRGSFASLNKDSHTLAYVPTSNEWMNWFRYEAGEADKIWLADIQTGKFEQLTNFKGVDTQPVWVGDSIYFISERSGVKNLWKVDPKTKKVEDTFETNRPVRNPASDGKTIVFECGPDLEIYDPITRKSRVLDIHLRSDHLHARPYEAPVGQADGAALSPTGKRVVLTSVGNLVTVPAGEGSMRVLVNDSSQRVQNPAWSPDGKNIAYVSDASGEEELYLIGTAENALPKQVTSHLEGENGLPTWSSDNKFVLIGNRAGDIKLIDVKSGAIKLVSHSAGMLEYDQVQNDFTFSPDSKWVAFSDSTGGKESVVQLYEIATGKITAVTDPTIDSNSPVFSPDGKYLFCTQARELGSKFMGNTDRITHDYSMKVTAIALAADTPTPFAPKDEDEPDAAKKPDEAPAKDTKIDLAGISDRYFDMKVPAGEYLALRAVPGRILLETATGVIAYDIASKAMIPLIMGAHGVSLSRDGKKLLVGSGGGIQVIDTGGGPAAPGAGAVKLAGLTVTVDPVSQWRQIFYESWRVARDFFYDPNTHGVDWNGIKKKYEAQLPMVASRDDLTRVLADMISEFNTGHCYVGGPASFVGRPPRPGLLGVDLAWDDAAGAYKIKHILKGDTWTPESRSPLAEPGVNVHEGDYILKIRGSTLKKDQDPASLLIGTAGLTIAVTVNTKPTLEGARTFPITPIASERALRNQDWVNSRRAYVQRASGGQIGYVYVGDMGTSGANQYARQYYPLVDKPAIIVDVRGNGGGNISGNLLNDLASKVTGYFTFRAGGNYRREGWAPLGQVVALTNEFAFSDGEYFSEFFKRLKIGPLIGHRTGGGEVGSGGGYRMVDGGTINIPNYGAWVPGEWVIEGRGAVPDIEVDQDPAAVMAGKDPQLDKAIVVILDNLKKHPFKLPVHPPFPVKLGGSRADKG